MPIAPEELSEDEEVELAADLHALRLELEAQLGNIAESVKPVDLEEPIGRLSRMDAMQQQKMAEASRRSVRQRFDRVGAALAACERGEYGLCLTCEEAIGYRRLKARPETALCLDCQSAKERR